MPVRTHDEEAQILAAWNFCTLSSQFLDARLRERCRREYSKGTDAKFSPSWANGLNTDTIKLHLGWGGGLVTNLCPTLCKPMNWCLPGSSVHGVLQARILKWVAISFSRWCSQPRDQTWVSSVAGRFFTNWAMREALELRIHMHCRHKDWFNIFHQLYSQVALVVKNMPAEAGVERDPGSICGLGRCPGEVHGNPLQYSCLENTMDRRAWWATIHRAEKSWTWLRRLGTQIQLCDLELVTYLSATQLPHR